MHHAEWISKHCPSYRQPANCIKRGMRLTKRTAEFGNCMHFAAETVWAWHWMFFNAWIYVCTTK